MNLSLTLALSLLPIFSSASATGGCFDGLNTVGSLPAEDCFDIYMARDPPRAPFRSVYVGPMFQSVSRNEDLDKIGEFFDEWSATLEQRVAEDPANAIWIAAENGDAERLRVLLENSSSDPRANYNKAIHMAVLKDHADCLELLLADPKVCLPADCDEIIATAVFHDSMECLRLLLADGRANPGACDNSAIRMAAWKQNAEYAKLLLANPRVDPCAVRPAVCLNPESFDLIVRIQAYRDGNLDTFQSADLTTLPEDELDILVFRNQKYLPVLRYLFDIQLARLAIPEAVKESRAYQTLIELGISDRPWKTSELRDLIKPLCA